MKAPPSRPPAAADAAAAAAAPTQAGAGGSGAAAAPAYRRTPSIEAALVAAPPDQLHGAGETTKKGKGRSFYTNIMQSGIGTAAYGLTRQQAAVAHDLVVAWRVHAHKRQRRSQNNTLHFPAAGYSQDEALLTQLRTVGTAFEMRDFVYAVLREQPSAAAVGAVPAPAGSRKRKQRPPARLPKPAGAGAEEGQLVGRGRSSRKTRSSGSGRGWPGAAAPLKDEEGEGGSLPPTRPVSPTEEAEEAPPARQEESAVPAPPHHRQQPAHTCSAGVTPATAAAQPAVQLPQLSPGMLPLLAERAAEAAQRKVEQAVQAFAAADRAAPASMLRPLQHLLRALDEQAGEALQEVVSGWARYSLARQQEVFDAALSAAAKGAWGRLEGQLRLALDLTSGG